MHRCLALGPISLIDAGDFRGLSNGYLDVRRLPHGVQISVAGPCSTTVHLVVVAFLREVCFNVRYYFLSSEEQGTPNMASNTTGAERVPAEKSEQPSTPQPQSIVYGPSAPVPITMTSGQLLDYHVELRGDRPAVISHVQGYTASWKQLKNRSLQLARAMSKDSIGKGDLVAISMGSRVEYFEVRVTMTQLQ